METLEVEVIALRALVGRQTARLASAVARHAALAAIVRRGLTAPSGAPLCVCGLYKGQCFYCQLRAALLAPEPAAGNGEDAG